MAVAWDYYHEVQFPAHCAPEWSFLPAVVLVAEDGYTYLAHIPMQTNEQGKYWSTSLNLWQGYSWDENAMPKERVNEQKDRSLRRN